MCRVHPIDLLEFFLIAAAISQLEKTERTAMLSVVSVECR